jgi:hypothetical protein
MRFKEFKVRRDRPLARVLLPFFQALYDDYGTNMDLTLLILEFTEGSTQLQIPDTWDFSIPPDVADNVPRFRGEWDAEGVYFYQAYRPEIADWAIQHQRLGGPFLKVDRMTWIKPSFGWMLYRCGYGLKNNGGRRVLKIKLSHAAASDILRECVCRERGGGTLGRVQWDPDRDLMTSEKKLPRKMLRQRAIQIGVKGPVAQYFRHCIISIEDVTSLANQVGVAHRKKGNKCARAMQNLLPQLPEERPYLPFLPDEKLRDLGMLEGDTSKMVAQLGRGKVEVSTTTGKGRGNFNVSAM